MTTLRSGLCYRKSVCLSSVCNVRAPILRQGRLHHINDRANAPWKKVGGSFCRNLGECTKLISSTKLKIFYTGTREFDNVLAIYLSEIPFHNSQIILLAYRTLHSHESEHIVDSLNGRFALSLNSRNTSTFFSSLVRQWLQDCNLNDIFRLCQDDFYRFLRTVLLSKFCPSVRQTRALSVADPGGGPGGHAPPLAA